MGEYKTRKIQFLKTITFDAWRVKIYTISKDGNFDHPVFFKNMMTELPKWLKMENSFNPKTDKIAFLILHAASEGILSIINWWVDDNMLNTHIFLTHYEDTSAFEKISGDGLGPCIWELEIMNHERLSWLNNVLKEAPQPNFERYLNDVINKEL
jgi:hypothetical protein